MIAAEEKKVLGERVELYKEHIFVLNSRISNLDSLIASLKQKDQNNTAIIQQLEEQKKIMEQQKGILLDQISKSNKQLRKQKRNTFFTALAGMAATVAALLL